MYDDPGARAGREREAYARSHPVRARILELYEEGRGQPLTAADLQRELDDLPRPTLVGVAYHVQVLRGVGLLPEFVG